MVSVSISIKNVLSIISEGAGSHFDPVLVDYFLKISLDKIVSVFLSEDNNKISQEDLPILKAHNLYDIKNYCAADSLSENDQNVLDLFNKYYLNKPSGDNNEI